MKTLLIIEDNEELRENTAEILDLAGYEVIQASNGKEGITIAQERVPDLIICDIMMPELDGYGTLHILSQNPSTSCIPFVFLTAKSEKLDIRKGMTLGADDYITKPYEELDLLNTIERRLKKVAQIKKLVDTTNLKTTFDPTFSHLKGDQKFQSLADDQETRSFNKKNIIYKEGSNPQRIFYLVSGKVKLYKMDEWGKELIHSVLHPGQYFGYLSLLENKLNGETAETLEESEIALIPKEDFFKLIYEDRDVAGHFIKLLSRNIIKKEEELLHLAYSSVRKRVAEKLIELSESSGEDGFHLTRDDLARMVGTSKESAIRTISDLKSEAMIAIEQKKIKILDIGALKKIMG